MTRLACSDRTPFVAHRQARQVRIPVYRDWSHRGSFLLVARVDNRQGNCSAPFLKLIVWVELGTNKGRWPTPSLSATRTYAQLCWRNNASVQVSVKTEKLCNRPTFGLGVPYCPVHTRVCGPLYRFPPGVLNSICVKPQGFRRHRQRHLHGMSRHSALHDCHAHRRITRGR
jgi:hypothetical protein